jgi:GT2 family glycosyltransferase
VGWTYRYEPRSVVYHEHAYSSKAGSAFFTFWVDRNRRLTLVKNAPLGAALLAGGGAVKGWAMHLVLHTFTRLRHLRPPSPHTFKEQTKHLLSFASAVPGAVRDRRAINRRRVVSHRAIQAWMVTK